jgi:NADP-dependent 3-hydroxy acid dehydrogenase YdfG
VWAISEGLRQEAGDEIRTTTISPGAVESELTSKITPEETAQNASALADMAIDASAVARASPTPSSSRRTWTPTK